VTVSSGAVPFGLGISHRGDFVVSEAGASTVSSYTGNASGSISGFAIGRDGSLALAGTAPASSL
jgi:hypothetical protein